MGRRPTGSPPSYRLHKQSGQAVVSIPISTGRYRDILLGPHGSPESRKEYARIVAEWETSRTATAPRRALPGRLTADVSVNEILLAYDKFAEGYYVKNGRPTQQLDRVRRSLRPVRELYGHTPAADFGPLALKAVRQAMIDLGYCRKLVNSYVGCVKRCFKWAVSQEMIPPSVFHGLQAVQRLLRGRTEAPETPPVLPVADEHVDAVLPLLTPPVRAMVQIQRLTGMRPGEVVLMRPRDIDRSGPVWLYTPETHKTEHHGVTRSVLIGPKAQAELQPFLDRSDDAYCFSPQEGMRAFRHLQRATRKSKVQPSQQNRRKKVKRKQPGERYTSTSYGRSIAYACQRLNRTREADGQPTIPNWHPNQLRHALATRVRREVGLDPARAILGHRSANTTEIYAEVDRLKAAEVMRIIG